jgi:two-component system phosphate regulon sensor histidine kinase PhoR
VASISSSGGQGHRLRDVRWREMLPLAQAVNHMAETIEAYVAETTDQRRQLETILDSMHEGLLVLGPGGEIRRWNKALSGLFPGVARAGGKPVIEGIPLPALQNRVDAVLKKENEPRGGPAEEDLEGAIHFEMPSGRFLAAHVTRPATRNGSLGAVIVVYDATEIMRLERVRRDFVSNVSHELRTPLTAIAGYAETLAAAGDLAGEYRNFAGIIHKHAVSLAWVINDLLALARIENTLEPVALEATCAEAAVHEAVSFVRGQAESGNIEIRLELEPALVLGNPSLLTQVFRNLLENACRYSPPESAVTVSSRRQGADVLFCVSDNGPGIPAGALPRIFERFYQVKKERNSGTAGIGLAICKHIVERHNGRIWAESPHGRSATAMLFTIPAAAPAQEKEA